MVADGGAPPPLDRRRCAPRWRSTSLTSPLEATEAAKARARGRIEVTGVEGGPWGPAMARAHGGGTVPPEASAGSIALPSRDAADGAEGERAPDVNGEAAPAGVAVVEQAVHVVHRRHEPPSIGIGQLGEQVASSADARPRTTPAASRSGSPPRVDECSPPPAPTTSPRSKRSSSSDVLADATSLATRWPRCSTAPPPPDRPFELGVDDVVRATSPTPSSW